ncbi:MAG: hypothetical protein V3R99_01885 [Thermoguttaceae bacterium]
MTCFRQALPARWPVVLLTTALLILFGRFGPSPFCVRAQEAAPVAPVAPAEQTDAAALPIFTNPRERLAWRNVDESHLARLIDGVPVDDNETETLMLLMYHYYRFPMTDVERWAQPAFDPAEVGRQADASRGLIYRLSGRITRAELLEPLPELVERFELSQYYRCELMLEGMSPDGTEQPAVIFAHDIPLAWQEGGELDGRVGVLGMFAKFSSLDDDKEHAKPVFVARRIAQYPETYLGDLGMDYGLLDRVEYRKPLSDNDREAFYQMLALTGRTKPGQLFGEAQRRLKSTDKELKRIDAAGNEHYPVVPLFNDAENQSGRLFVLEGTARRIVRIRVEDPDVQERFGIDHYYNLFVFTDDSQSNPIVFCVRELPEGMPVGDGLNFGEHVRVAGFFFKTWAYRVERTKDSTVPAAAGAKSRQLAPLLIGREPVWYPAEPIPTSTMAGAIAAGLFVVAMAGIWFALWRYGRGDREFRKQTIARAIAPESGVSLDEIVEAGEEPRDRFDSIEL